MIIIHWDFTDGTEVSYAEGIKLKDNFTTCCTDFFTTEHETDVIVLSKESGYISKLELINDTDNVYINKEIRKEHNIHKMLIAGAFKFRLVEDSI